MRETKQIKARVFSIIQKNTRFYYDASRLKGFLHDSFRVEPRSDKAFLNDNFPIDTEHVPVPGLFKACFNSGAKTRGAPIIDREFGTIDFFIVCDAYRMSGKYRRLFA